MHLDARLLPREPDAGARGSKAVTDLAKLRELAKAAKDVNSTHLCSDCSFQTLYRHRHECTRPEEAFTLAAQPSVVLALLDRLERAEKALREIKSQATRRYRAADNKHLLESDLEIIESLVGRGLPSDLPNEESSALKSSNSPGPG
jgi:hypothetical protein